MNFSVAPRHDGDGFRIRRRAAGRPLAQLLRSDGDPAGLQRLLPRARATISGRACRTSTAGQPNVRRAPFRWQPLLTENVHPQILVGYGDPAVLKTDEGWWLIATSNDAPDAFPILHSSDLEGWEAEGLHLSRGTAARHGRRQGATPPTSGPRRWRRSARNIGPSSPRGRSSNALAIGLARAPSPLGPWVDNGAAARHRQADQHDWSRLRSRPAADERRRDRFPPVPRSEWRSLPVLEGRHERHLATSARDAAAASSRSSIDELFASEADRRTAAFAAAIVPWANEQRPMTRFFVMQPIIEAALAQLEAGPRASSPSSALPRQRSSKR